MASDADAVNPRSRRNSRHFTKKEVALAKKHALAGATLKQISAALLEELGSRRTPAAVGIKLRRMGTPWNVNQRPDAWTLEEDTIVRNYYPEFGGIGVRAVLHYLGYHRSTSAIHARVSNRRMPNTVGARLARHKKVSKPSGPMSSQMVVKGIIMRNIKASGLVDLEDLAGRFRIKPNALEVAAAELVKSGTIAALGDGLFAIPEEEAA
jgi:hypothetical protein